MKQLKQYLIPCAISLILGVLGTWILKPTQPPNALEYDLRNEINRLNYEKEVQTIKADYLYKLHFVENSTPEEIDSLWGTFGF